MSKLSKSKKVILIGIFCIIVLVIVILNLNRGSIDWNQYKNARPFSEISKDQVGMTDETRKQIFWDLVELQDKFTKIDPYDTQSQEDAYEMIALKYDVLESVVRDIAIRGIRENWPKPTLK